MIWFPRCRAITVPSCLLHGIGKLKNGNICLGVDSHKSGSHLAGEKCRGVVIHCKSTN